MKPEDVEVDIVRVEVAQEAEKAGIEESELDEMWSFVGEENQPKVAVACN